MTAHYAAALSGFAALVDEKTGIIRSVDLLKLSERDPRVFVAHAEPSDTTPLTGMAAANRGAASSPDFERAVVRACGESIERYCSCFFDFNAFRLATEAELTYDGQRFVSTRDLYPFAPWQYEQEGFPYKAIDGRRLRWVPGTSLASGEEVWLPASCVYVPYLFDAAVEPFTHMPISTGLAAGPTHQACIRKGILEILERDALMLVWLARRQCPRIDPETCWRVSPLVDELLAAAWPGGPTWHLNLLTLDVPVPIVSAALIDPGPLPLTSFGIAADPSPAHALLLALEEATLTRVMVNRSREATEPPEYDATGVRTLRDHLFAHATSPALRESLRFMSDEGPLVTFGELTERQWAETDEAVTEHLLGLGFEPVSIDVTTDDVAALGFRVVRTAIGGMQPLDNDHSHRYLGGQRLRRPPPGLGFSNDVGESPNPDPHPFP